LRSDNGTIFTLIEDINFWKIDPDFGDYIVDDKVVVTNGRKVAGQIVSKYLKKSGLCTSGKESSQSFYLSDFVPFRRLTLSEQNITKIISVVDGNGNNYYEVDNLTHDVVYKNVINTSEKDSLVKDSLKVIPCPYRFIKRVSLGDRNTSIILGGGSADSTEDDIIPDPSEFALPLPYSQTFSRVAINPQKLLQTSTLGICAANTNLKVTYRYGGGLSHNVPAGTIRDVLSTNISFPANPPIVLQLQVKNSIEVTNPEPAAGGEDPPTVEELLQLVSSVKSSQERIVTKEDMLARVYSMPSNFGRVFRAAVSSNPNNPLATQLFIVSRDNEQQLIPSPDSLKINLKRYLNSYRMISDSIDVQDAGIINLELYFSIVADPAMNKASLLQSIIRDLRDQFDIKNFHINQPIIISDIESTIFSKQGVISVDKIQFRNIYGTVNNRKYSSINFNVNSYIKNKILYPPTGTIFEIKYPDVNIVGKVVANV